MLKHLIKYKIVIFILAIGFFLRIYQIESAPPSLNWDEVSHGYNAYSILKTGKDEWGVTTPIIFRAYGDYKLPVYIYLAAISENFLGLNELAVRLPSIFAGTLTILFAYLLSIHLFKSSKLALAVAFLMALSPWSLFLSRIALEANVSLLFVVAGVYFLILGLQKRNYFLLAAAISLGLSVWTYNSARVFTPLILLAVLLSHKLSMVQLTKERKRLVFISLGVLLFFLIPMAMQLLSPVGQARYENVQIIDSGAIGRIHELRENVSLPSVLERAIFNKATYFFVSFVENYVKYFSPDFLFLNGGKNYQFSVPGQGLLFFVTIPLLLYGIWSALKKKKNINIKIILFWLIISPIAGSITREAPHVLRGIYMLIPILLLSAYGLLELESKFKNKHFSLIFVILILMGFADYYHEYRTSYRQSYSWSWQYGYKEAVDYALEAYNNYEKILITKKYGEPHEFVLFYSSWKPEKYINDKNLVRFSQSNWFWIDAFDKFYFLNDWQIPPEGSEFVLESGGKFNCASCLLITSPGNAPAGWKKLREIYFLDGKIAFEIYEN